MVLGGSWWFLAVHGDSWWFLVVLGGSWWFFMVLGDSCCVLLQCLSVRIKVLIEVP